MNNAIIVAVLHDVLEDTKCTRDELLEVVGEEIVSIIEEVNNL